MSLFGSIANIGMGFAQGGFLGGFQALQGEVVKAGMQAGSTTSPTSKLLGTLSGFGLKGNFQFPTISSQPITKMAPPLTLQLPAGPGMTPPLIPPDSTVTRGGLSMSGPFGTGLQVGGTTTSYYPTGSSPGAANGCPKGYHLNKAGYYRRGQYVAAGTACVKNRRRNPLNPRALSRAISRIQSGKNAAAFLSRVSVRGGGCGCK